MSTHRPEFPETPVAAARALWNNDQQQEVELNHLADLRGQYAEAVTALRLTYSKVYLELAGQPEHVRRRTAEKETINEFYAEQALQASIENSRDKLRVLRDRSETLRAINANIKEDLRTAGMRS